MIEVELLESLYTQSLKLSKIGHDKSRSTGNPLKKTWNSGGPVLLSAPGAGPPTWLWSGHPAPGAQCRPGQPIQLGCGSLLHRLLPARLRLLQSHCYSLWQQVQNLNNLPVISSAGGDQPLVNIVFKKHSFALIFVSFCGVLFLFSGSGRFLVLVRKPLRRWSLTSADPPMHSVLIS